MTEPITFEQALEKNPRFLEEKRDREFNADIQWMNDTLTERAHELKNGAELKIHNIVLNHVPALRTAYPEFTIPEYNSYPAIGIQLKTK
jgi:hypothetical protein